jgi:DNA-directed RNA polymerase subunit F
MFYQHDQQQVNEDKSKLIQKLTSKGIKPKAAQKIADICALANTIGFSLWPTPDKEICVKSIVYTTPTQDEEIDFLFSNTGRLVRTRKGKY